MEDLFPNIVRERARPAARRVSASQEARNRYKKIREASTILQPADFWSLMVTAVVVSAVHSFRVVLIPLAIVLGLLVGMLIRPTDKGRVKVLRRRVQ